jgi:ATP-dependent Clp protease ATP-binding subunit ClpA
LDGGVFERFSERARQVVVLAQQEAVAFGHDHIGTEHLLLGLLCEEEGTAARVLAESGVELETARASVLALVGEGETARSGQIPFTPRGKQVLELALREALSLGDNHIGTRHLLLGLLRVGDGRANDVLDELGVDSESLRVQLTGPLAGEPEHVRRTRPRRQPRRWRYAVEPLGALESAAELAALGEAGWELVAVIGEPGAYRGVFKRPR